jgi:hypothetical protein
MPKSIESDAYAEYRRCFSDPATNEPSPRDRESSLHRREPIEALFLLFSE